MQELIKQLEGKTAVAKELGAAIKAALEKLVSAGVEEPGDFVNEIVETALND